MPSLYDVVLTAHDTYRQRELERGPFGTQFGSDGRSARQIADDRHAETTDALAAEIADDPRPTIDLLARELHATWRPEVLDRPHRGREDHDDGPSPSIEALDALGTAHGAALEEVIDHVVADPTRVRAALHNGSLDLGWLALDDQLLLDRFRKAAGLGDDGPR